MSSPHAGIVIAGLRALSSEMDRLDEVAAQLYGLNRTDMRALEIVGRRGPIAPSELARLLGFTTGGVTTVLDRLEQAGYIRRRPAPADRRRLLVEATAATAARDAEVFGPLIRHTTDLLATYTSDQLQVIDDFLTRTRQLTAVYADTLTSAAGPGAPGHDDGQQAGQAR